jgi:glycosyltransferase XagB
VYSAIAVTVLVVLLTAALLIPACVNLWWMLHAWRSPETYAAIAGAPAESTLTKSFSAIVPFRHEAEEVVRGTVARLLDQTHPDVEVVLAVGDDDPDAVEMAGRMAAENPHRVRVSIDASASKNKPKQLNTALAACRNEFVCIFDAESLTHPELFAAADAVLTSTGAPVLQYGVQLVNHRTRWFSLRNCLEYYFWFRSRLHLQARKGFIPLGGTTVFINRLLLKSVGGWDGGALTEDADLGVRLSVRRKRIAVAYDPQLVTREETPDTVGSLVRQRSRWNQGFLQVLAKGDWRVLPTRRQRWLAQFTLLQPYVQSVTFFAMPVGLLLAVFGGLPLPLALLTFAPLVPTIATLLFEIAALGEFGRTLGLPVGPRDFARLVLTLFPYQMIMGWASLRGLVRHLRGRNDWEKTAHAGHHLTPAPAPTPAMATTIGSNA